MWPGIPAGPGGHLAAALAVRRGPPRHYELDGDTYEVRASWWPLLELLPGTGWRLPLVLDMTHPDDAAVLRRRLHDRGDPLRLDVVERIGGGLVESATGRPWWVAERLYSWTLAHFAELDGRLPVDLAALLEGNPARVCNVVHMALVEGADEKSRTQFDAELYRPPPTMTADEVPAWVAEDEGNSFMSAMGMMGGLKGAMPARPAEAGP